MLVVSLRRAIDAVSSLCSAGVMDDYVGPRLSLVAAQCAMALSRRTCQTDDVHSYVS